MEKAKMINNRINDIEASFVFSIFMVMFRYIQLANVHMLFCKFPHHFGQSNKKQHPMEKDHAIETQMLKQFLQLNLLENYKRLY